MKKVGQGLWILLAVVALFSVRGWMIQRNNTPLEVKFDSEIQVFESTYGKGETSKADECVIRIVDLDDQGTRFLVAGHGYEDWILLDLLIRDQAVVEVDLVYSIESDGYGSYVEEDWFLKRVLLPATRELELVKYRKQAAYEVVAITGATETSQGVVDAVNACMNWQMK